MRDYRFRGWDVRRKVMFPVLSFDQYEVIQATPDLQSRYASWPRADIKIMQATGRVDKYRREIFEGDITDIGVVTWFHDLTWDGGGSSHPGFYFKGPYTRNEELMYADGFDRCEVIGNIYDNPELVKA